MSRLRSRPWAVAAAIFALLLAGCASPGPALHARAPDVAARLGEGASWTVITFFSASCPCQRLHDARVGALYATFAPRGVRFVGVDAEADATPAKDAEEARRRGYPFALLSDPDGRLADALGVTAATESVVLDREGRVRFHGGLDSDRVTATDDAPPYLRDALDALLRGEEPPDPAPKALGCAIRRR
ncbi:MAG: hypothetical protein NVSMB47_11260 [Polyangiales bacterium]